MKRRRFLQLAASAAAGAGARHAAGFPTFRRTSREGPCLLRMKPVRLAPAASNFPNATLISFHAEPAATPATLQAMRQAAAQPLLRLPVPPRADPTQESAVLIELMLEHRPGTENTENHWLINGHPVSRQAALPLIPGRRYRLRCINATADAHLIHLQDHPSQITRMQQTAIAGMHTSSIYLQRYAVIDAEVVVRRPGSQFL